jgi:hypothetical protein
MITIGMDQKTFPLENLHSTSSLALPRGWKKGTTSHGRFSHCQQFHPADEDDVAVVVTCRGHQLSEEAAAKFLAVLKTPAHALDDLERRRISEVLDDQIVKARFILAAARTEEWQGKTVLVTEGTYATSGDQAYTIFVDADGDGTWVEEFQYFSPSEKFHVHFNDALATFKAIQWNS